MVEGVEFVDENVGKNWSPYNHLVIPDAVRAKIKTDIAAGLEEII